MNQDPIAEVVGKLLYLSPTCLDILYSVNILSQFMHTQRNHRSHFQTVENEEYSLLNLRGSVEELSGYLLIYRGLSNNCKYALLIFIDMPLQLNEKVIVELKGYSKELDKYPFNISETQLPLPFSVHAFFCKLSPTYWSSISAQIQNRVQGKKKENPLPFPWR